MKRLLLASLLVCLHLSCPPGVVAAPTEAEVQAAFTLKFCGYINWPRSAFPSDGSPIRIAVAGNVSVFKKMRRLASARHVKGRPYQIIQLQPGAAVNNIHVVYVDSKKFADFNDLIQDLRSEPVLIVTDIQEPNDVEKMGAINFVKVNSSIRFDVSLYLAREAGIEIASELLAVANRVVEGAPRL